MSNFGYSPIDLSDEIFSSEASIDLWISSIESQFKSPMDDRKRDYIESFITRYEYELENTVDENDVVNGPLSEEVSESFLAMVEKENEEVVKRLKEERINKEAEEKKDEEKDSKSNQKSQERQVR